MKKPKNKLSTIIVNAIDDYLAGNLGTYVKARSTKKTMKAEAPVKAPTKKATRKHPSHHTRPTTMLRWRGAATVKFMTDRWPDISPGAEQFTKGQLKGTGPTPQANLLARQVYAAGIAAERKTGVFDPLAEYRANKRVRNHINYQLRKARDEKWGASKAR